MKFVDDDDDDDYVILKTQHTKYIVDENTPRNV